MDPKLRSQLIRDEGYKLTSYQDSLGFWTIGVGHFLGTRRRMLDITPEECEALLEADYTEAKDIVLELCPVVRGIGVTSPLDVPRYHALVNMAFNLGSRLGQFVMFLGAVNVGNWPLAAERMMKSKWATQVGARATRLRDVILTGVD